MSNVKKENERISNLFATEVYKMLSANSIHSIIRFKGEESKA